MEPRKQAAAGGLKPLDRRRPFRPGRPAAIGDGGPGGKAAGLIAACRALRDHFGAPEPGGVEVAVPPFVVVTTRLFDLFLDRNGIEPAALAGLPDDRVARLFQEGDLPTQFLGDLRSLVERQHAPLAVRSSSLLEDALREPFAGVYATKMIPNNQYDPDTRFRKLAEAIKFVWASTWFAGARRYRRAAGREAGEEKMALLVQEIVGERFHGRYYPHFSGVARSFNYYPTGHARPDQGVVQLALGLGRVIVEGGTVWTWSPAYPRSGPPYASALDRVRGTQNRFWAVNMGEPENWDPLRETEYLVECDLLQAERDGTLEHLASTYDPQADRLYPGSGRPGPRVLDFAPLLVLERYGLNRLVQELLELCARELGEPVEIEFAGTLPRRGRGKAFLGFLQVRPLVVCQARVDIAEEELDDPRVVVVSDQVMGNGRVEGVRDVLYLRPDRFDPARSREIAGEVAGLNDALREEGAGMVLIGFGRWGSSDPWLGVPVDWSGIGQARVIVESTLPAMQVEMSQGSHFFHNLTSFQVPYFSVPQGGRGRIDWAWLEGLPAMRETEHARWVRLAEPLAVRVDGRRGRGYIRRGNHD